MSTDGELAEITRLLERLRDGDLDAEGPLFEHLYRELRTIAGRMFARQRADHTLQPTALVHEAYLRLARPGSAWQDRTHFCAVAARAMRQILINHARDQAALKRGGGAAGRSLSMHDAVDDGGRPLDVLALDEALATLGTLDARQGRIAELRLFAGLSCAEVATALGVSKRTAELDWKMAKTWLAARLDPAPPDAHGG